MYGKNNPSAKKRLVVVGLQTGKNFGELAADLSNTKATAEVYGIDGLAAGQQIDHEMLSRLLDVSADSFKLIKNYILACEDRKLHTVRDNLLQEFSYNQIRFMLACLIHELEL